LKVLGLEMDKDKGLSCSDWGQWPLTHRQVSLFKYIQINFEGFKDADAMSLSDQGGSKGDTIRYNPFANLQYSVYAES
jgi:hypothetical protein